ncbi:hypothetical protein PUR71_27225 [Streptomyces sp. SP17BM10]|uniref:hypothetical protein n=1 Tax=Streptomyces sp. SP17BM10 TaxID=3002530 RepID=UPI002E7A1139|nr:hypothetical protein [Streptomyces sp. SP17BM10]MEE1786565.1 hypothetical protein [Streptomyces sp. SP17BM10]
MIVSKRNSLRLAAVTAVSVLSIGLAGTAMAATPATPATPAAQPVAAAAAQAGITAKPSVSSVRAWELFRVNGTTTGLKPGTKVTLQQKQHGTWVTLPASVNTNGKGSYSLGVKLGIKGLNELRIVSGSTASPVFTVTVG